MQYLQDGDARRFVEKEDSLTNFASSSSPSALYDTSIAINPIARSSVEAERIMR